MAIGLTFVSSTASSQVPTRPDTTRAARDTVRTDSTAQGDSALTVDLFGRLEFKGERISNDRCFANQLYSLTFRCASQITPQLDFQFSLRSAGLVSDRVRVDVDYDSQREFDGSNNISLAYRGRVGDFLERLEIGNVTFRTPVSRFLTSGIPSGNYGIQASGSIGRFRYSAIAAQQRGNVLRDTVFTVGGRSTRFPVRTIHDYQLEARRFFFTVDPALFTTRYPNIDILNASEMNTLAASLPETQRPVKVSLYRVILGGQPPNPNGPQFALLEAPEVRVGQVYEHLREGVDYYIDPSQLWIALVRPLSLQNERLVAAWTLRIAGRDTVVAALGGTPDLEFKTEYQQFAHLLWDPGVTPEDQVFRREIRSVYRLGGEDVRRESVNLRVVAGNSNDEEKAPGVPNTYLEIFGLSQPTNRAIFNFDNRLWPRRQDPNFNLGAPVVSETDLIRDVFIVYPSLEPFSRRGLAFAPNVVSNDTIYRTPGEYLFSAQHPQSVYRMLASYESSGSATPGTIALASSQIRPGSERLTIDGRPLTRGVDYEIDYDLGTVRLLTADSLALRPRRVMLQYEENPLFQSVPTSVAGLTTEWSMPFGTVSLTAMWQQQRTNFTRPAVGYEPQASLVAGIGANLGWGLPGVSRALSKVLPLVDSLMPSRLDITAELAVSRPRQRGGQAYIESFEGLGGLGVNLLESSWQYSSQPALGTRLQQRVGASTLDTTRASTMAWQNYGSDVAGRPVTFTFQQIDPRTTLPSGAISQFEQMLWLTLYPLPIGGLADAETGQPRWRVAGTPSGRRWRSVRTPLGTAGTGVDLTRGEYIEFWTQIDTSAVRRSQNALLILDFGDISENSVAFAPESLRVVEGDSVYSGKQLQGWDRLDTERDRFSRAFSADVNDIGLPGDVVDALQVRSEGIPILATNFQTCQLGAGRLLPLGDARIDCTVRNSRLDEEDIDQDATLNFGSTQREQERIRRYVVDLSRPESYYRIGVCGPAVRDVNQSQPPGTNVCWVNFRIPFNTPDETIAGGPLLRRVRALRITVVSGETATDDRYTQVPLARLSVTGATWLKRAARPLNGLAGEQQALGGFVIASSIGTQDVDSARGLVYEPPPGVTDEPEQQQTGVGFTASSINETSMRILASGDMPAQSRAEAYTRFPEGQQNVMSYRELRAWARGRGRGWGPDGDLHFFIKLGRDANNFYAYHTFVHVGGREAWEPEIRVPFERFYQLRAQLESDVLAGRSGWSGCTAADSALIGSSGPPPTASGARYAACSEGFIVYTVDPIVTPPNLAAVQEIAAGILRVDSLGGTNPPTASDTVELWIDDIRLSDVEQRPGYAGYIGATFTAGDAGVVRVSASRHDPFFRQLAERPSYNALGDLEIATTWRLEKLLPWRTPLTLPLTITYNAARADPEFLVGSDLRGAAVDELRTPQGGTTSVALQARLASPVGPSWYAPIVNNVGLSVNWNGAEARTAYQRGRTRGFEIGADYAWLTSPAGEPPKFSLVPTVVRVISNLARASGVADAFVRPSEAGSDEFRRTGATSNLWRSSTSLEFRPLPAVTARWDALSLRDLRDYGTVTPNAIAAARERVDLAGVDVGLERERVMGATINVVPLPQYWVRPRLELASGYTLLRDPNAPGVAAPGEEGLHLARRFGNSQRASASAVFDLPMVAQDMEDGSVGRRLARFFGPIDVSVGRDHISAYDAAPLTPGWGYQFGLAEFDDIREINGVSATTAGAGTRFAASNTFTLPFGASIAQRVQRTDSRHYSRRFINRLTLVDGDQVVFPDVTFRWSGQPAALTSLLSSISATVRAVQTRQAFVSPPDIEAGDFERRITRLRSYPATLTMNGPDNDLSITLSFSRSDRADSLPGSAGESRTIDGGADLTKAFPLPASWNLPSGLRTRIAYTQSETQSYVSNLASLSQRSRLTDNGRQALSLNADTDLADNISFSLQASRVVTFDHNFNRRFTQTLFSAVLNIQFFSGAF